MKMSLSTLFYTLSIASTSALPGKQPMNDLLHRRMRTFHKGLRTFTQFAHIDLARRAITGEFWLLIARARLL